MACADHLILNGETTFHLEVYAALGRVVVGWGMVENHFNMCLMLLYHNLGGSDIWTKKPPIPFGKKIEFWTKCFDELPELAHLKQAGHEFADLIIDAAEDRNKIFHYSWIDVINKKDQGDIQGHSVEPTRDGYNTYRTSFNAESLLKLARHLDGLNTRLLGYSLTLMQLKRK